jgi:hypothetical protein
VERRPEHEARREGVDAHALRPEFAREPERKREQRAFRGRVGDGATAARDTRRALPRLSDIVSAQKSSSESANAFRATIAPALLMRMSRPPRNWTACSTSGLQPSVEVRSALALAQRRPSCFASASTRLAPAALR